MEPDELAESIAASLSRLRGRRPGMRPDHHHDGHRDGRDGRGGMHGGHGRGHRRGHDHADVGDDRGAPGIGGFPVPPWGAGRFGPPARFRLLEVLAAFDAPLTVGELAERIGVDQPRASRLVAQGVQMELVRREADPDDARRTRIALTERGRAFARGVRGERRESIQAGLAALDEVERAEFARLLAKFAAAWPAPGER